VGLAAGLVRSADGDAFGCTCIADRLGATMGWAGLAGDPTGVDDIHTPDQERESFKS
jgi:hypothetical protein